VSLPAAAGHDVVAVGDRGHEEGVVAVAAVEGVVTRAAGDRVVARPP